MKLASTLIIAVLCLIGTSVLAEEADHEYRVLGLFQANCVDDLREVTEKVSGIALVKADYLTGITTFRMDAAKVFPDAKSPAQITENLRNKLNGASQGVFETHPLSSLPREKLKEVKIPIAGLDCKGCSYAAYLAVYKIEGVENATASFKEGLVIAWIDPSKTNHAALEEALTKRGVTLAKPE
ncbi:MAG: copper chaperone CopZ [Verrucomicrobiales bacterium]|jgi:copper chaperone CopZ